jgi:hypothetical protein
MRAIRQIRRSIRKPVKYAQAVWRWKRFTFDKMPPIFGNAKPKSGSHLLVQILRGFTQIMPYAYVEAEPVRTISKEGRRKENEEILAELRHIPRGVIGWGYIECSPENIAFLCQPGRANYLIFRDPRDMLVSQVFFATDMYEEHGMHAYYNSLPNFGERLKAAITGVDKDGFRMVSVRQRYEMVLQWRDQKHVMCVRYEDLMDNREATLKAMLDEVETTGYRIPTVREEALAVLVRAIQPEKSHTFRSGRTGEWRELFSAEHKSLFKDVTGDLLVRLGYEKGNDW